MKALEKILDYEFEENKVPTAVCTVDFIRSVYNLINELRNEICYFEDRIDEINTENNEVIDSQQAEIEELRADNNYLFENMPHMKAEAIKEFIEKFKAYIPSIDGDTTMDCVERAIKQAKKEMAGESNAQFTTNNSQLELLREKCIEHQDFHKGDDGKFRGWISVEDLDRVIDEL